MEKFTEYHEGRNSIPVDKASYLKHAFNIGYKSNIVSIPIEKYITLEMKARLSEMLDALFIDSMIYIVSVGDFSMAYHDINKARKGLKHLEDQHVQSMFGARV